MADEAAAEEVPITFSVKSSNDAKHVVTLPLSLTVLELKTKLAGSDYVDIPPERQRLIYSGRVLKDENTLSSYKIKEGNTIHLVKAAASNQRQNPTSSSTAAAGSGEAPPPTSTGVPSNLAAGTGNNPLAGLTGARYAGFAQLPGAGMFGPDGGVSVLDLPDFNTLTLIIHTTIIDGPTSRPGTHALSVGKPAVCFNDERSPPKSPSDRSNDSSQSPSPQHGTPSPPSYARP